MSSTPTAERFSRENTDPTDGSGPAEQAQQKAQEGAEKAKGALRSQVDERTTTLGEQLGTHAGDARTVAEELRKQGKDGPAKAAEQAAERAERASGYLKDADADRILSDAEDYARSNPWAVVAGGLAAGFLASRFLKASSQQRQATGGGAPRGQLGAGGPGQPSPTSDGVGSTSLPGRPVT